VPAVDLSLPFAPSWTWCLGGETGTLAGSADCQEEEEEEFIQNRTRAGARFLTEEEEESNLINLKR
jgi:hypothetical protein